MARRPLEDTEPCVQQLFQGPYQETDMGSKGLAKAGLSVEIVKNQLDNKEHWAVLLFGAAIVFWYFPDKVFPVGIPAGEGQIVGAIFLVGGFLLWYIPPNSE